ncbi:MAG: hypothetical protein Ct9H90mP18_02290 [Gammaproteobacteria bacterium]|nr:MAG: hypothetical protein Ct9H90mP18_02290 [Gammaproteobacteria bacterium]
MPRLKKGGFIVDACKSGDKIPKTLLQTKLPKTWRLILVNDKKSRGQFGKPELDFFNKTKKQKSFLMNCLILFYEGFCHQFFMMSSINLLLLSMNFKI